MHSHADLFLDARAESLFSLPGRLLGPLLVASLAFWIGPHEQESAYSPLE